jgi:hypothetical protein
MTAPGADDIALIQATLDAVSCAANRGDALRAVHDSERLRSSPIAEQRQREHANGIEAGYQRLLAGFGGDADCLARMLYSYALELMPNSVEDSSDYKQTGRPPDKWGRDGAGKWMLYFLIEQVRKEMREAGSKRPTIQDAIAQYLGVPPARRGRASVEAQIRDYAARYSEGKKILKRVGKLDAIK